MPEEYRRPDMLRHWLAVLRAHKNQLWAELQTHTDFNESQANDLHSVKELLEQCVAARKYEIDVVNRKMERYQRYLDLLEPREVDPSMNQIM